MGKSRSVSTVIAYLLWKYPHRYGGGGAKASGTEAARREIMQGGIVKTVIANAAKGKSIMHSVLRVTYA